ncbi:MAG: 3-hydroxyacyl-CoA dehydrogenase family protein [Flammeovirgaceae bacterium]|jgi:3-hydroxybutyryl-CoA dehydrogenase|nr:3-hydroxyacyl-CoA dehydrogenase family protein [Flammeovirgaceae bacterium]
MNILVIGSHANAQECRDKFGPSHGYTRVDHQQEAEKFFGTSDVVFDFVIEKDRSQMEVYRDHKGVTAFLNTSLVSLLELSTEVKNQIHCTLFGFCGLPTFLNRELLEISLRREEDSTELQRICKLLQTDFVVVVDRVGLVTPRVICMIINEAFYTVQEGTASKKDIDIAMKLGTNYPLGPFEWAKKIGIENVYLVLDSVYKDTKDERYKICPLLKKEYLNQIIQP